LDRHTIPWPLWSKLMHSAPVFTGLNSSAKARLQKEPKHHRPGINAYGATAPARFFTVASEYFFTARQTLKKHYPAVYDQLAAFYRQDTAER